ncbi:alpha-L-rhamnosidase-like protein [Nitrospirillum amazonense]|uniref:Alpha-L-rhamnosidase-like protein n=1 Tax=Nitrospirillum amazonense TaxID=28077 RepID=A0A560F9T0_9PROT|nr:alpha-L-rhamnosidase C-terminal domain-containing protein [Nitrospirillum amazonense]TWB18373.1 alpha-L-rhamnosidase-like protein [Nitrospirillum amazonense]
MRLPSITLARILALCLAAPTGPAAAQGAAVSAEGQGAAASASGWITHPDAAVRERPIVLDFRRTFDLAAVPAAFPVTVTADNRFNLYVNGVRVAMGPSTGDIAHWRMEALDLAPYLRPGRNVIAAEVWNFVKPPPVLPSNATDAQKRAAAGGELFSQTAPIFQQSVDTGFRLRGDGPAAAVGTDQAGWRVAVDGGRSAVNGYRQVRRWFYVAGSPEVIDAAKANWDWMAVAEPKGDWREAVPAPGAAARTLTIDRLPQQEYAPVPAGTVVRSDLDGGKAFPGHAVTVPANTHVKLLLRRDAMISAYPELAVSGGKDAVIKQTYAEALYDDQFKKADRDLVDDRKAVGIWDTFTADGGRRVFQPLWWRTWRYLDIDVVTQGEPLTLDGLRVFETGYPFQQIGSFKSSDPVLDHIWQVGWRTARVDAHETYMDTAFWEQNQYVGDTRLQALISYAVGGDPRLAEQAIDAFAQSDVDDGLVEGAYPVRNSNAIAPFSLLWVGMLHDWWMQQPDTGPVVRHLDRMRKVLHWFERYQAPSGLLTKNPQWNFIDWAGQPATDRTKFPSYGKDGESCLMSVSWLGALRQGAALEKALGDLAQAAADTARADAVRAALRARCWQAGRGLYADNPDGDVFSQHTNTLAVLYDVATPEEAPAILRRITKAGGGIDAPDGMYVSSYYFAWYLAQAFVHAGLADDYHALLQTWRDLLALHYTTWPEERGNTRSDTHAWSAHPTADLLDIVAGIQPGAPGYAAVRIQPALGALTQLDATAATPHGAVTIRYRVVGAKMVADIRRPKDLPGEFVWQGRTYPLDAVETHLSVPAPRREER